MNKAPARNPKINQRTSGISLRAVALFLTLPFMTGCDAWWNWLYPAPPPLPYHYPEAPSPAKTPSVVWGEHRFWVEVADQPESIARGLMYRNHLPEGHGMLFVHDQNQILSYWMRNTRIPLDIVYFDQNGKHVSNHQMVPPCTDMPCPSYQSGQPARYVLELPAGTLRQRQINLDQPLKWGSTVRPNSVGLRSHQ